MIKFIGQLIILTIIILGIAFTLEHFLSTPILDPQFERMIGIFFVVTSIAHTIFHIGSKKNIEKAVFFSFISIGIHFLLNLTCVTVLIFQGVENTIIFFFNFFVLYLCYTLFDIYLLITNLRQNS